MKKIIKSIQRWILLWDLRGIMFFCIIFLFGYYVVSIRDHLVLYEDNGKTIMLSDIFLILILISSAIFLYAYIYLVVGTSKRIIRKPYRIELGTHDKDEIFSLLNDKLQLKKVEEDCCYAEETIFIWWLFAVRAMRLFVFLFEDNNDNGLDIANQYVKVVNEMTDFRPAPRVRTQITTFRNQIFIYDKLPETILEISQDNVERDNIENDILTNFFIDLSEGALYIPFLCTRTNVGLKHRTYLHAIKRVGEYLDLI